MNSTKTLSDKSRFSNKPFFSFTLKNNWQHFALYFIIMLLAIVLPCVMMINEYSRYTDEYCNWSAITANTVVTCGITGVLASLAVAVFSDMSAVSYINSKQTVGCYHSFPIRREGMFVIETSVRAIYYLTAYLPCALIALVLINISLDMTAALNMVYMKHILSAILCYLLLYSIILFAGGLTGTAPVRLIMTLLILYLPLVLYALLIVNAYIGMPRLNADYYLSEEVLRVICSTYRVGEAVGRIDSNISPEQFYNIFWCIPEIIVYYVGALLLHKYRKSESSGTTIIWKPVFLFTKYITIFTAALLGIAIFGSDLFGISNGNTMWIIFGLVFGIVISSMVVNAILYRSSKAIFKGLRGLATVTILAVVFMIVLPMDAFGMNEKIYDADNTKSLEIRQIVYEDTDDLENLIALLRDEGISNEQRYYDEYVCFWNETNSEELIDNFHYMIYTSAEEAEAAVDDYTKENYDFSYDSSSYIDIVQKPKFGLPLARRIYINKNGEFWDTIARSAEYTEAEEQLIKVDVNDIYGVDIQLADFSEYVDLYSHIYDEKTIIVRESAETRASSNSYGAQYDTTLIRDILAEILPYCLYDADNRDDGVIVGTIRINIESKTQSAELLQYTSAIYPIYADNLEVLNGVCRMLNEIYGNVVNYEPYPTFTSGEEYLDYFVENSIKAIAIIDSETGEIRSMPIESFKTIESSFSALRDSGFNVADYVKVYDSRYWIVASFKSAMASEYNSTRSLYFRDGSITDDKLAELFELSK